MSSVNKMILLGNLGQDPEMRTGQNGKQIANFSIATTEYWKDKQTGEKREKTEWHNCVAFDRQADIIGQYLKKGSKVYLECASTTNKWTDNDGKDHYRHQFVVRELQMLDTRSATSGNQQPAPQQQQMQPAPQQQQMQPAPQQPASGGVDFDDDIPF